MTLDSVREEIEKAKHIVILTHEYPDGDAIGCSLAMYHALCQLGKDVDVLNTEFLPQFINETDLPDERRILHMDN